MSSLEDFSDILKRGEPLAPLTWLKVGGTASHLAEPQSVEQLQSLVQCCNEQSVPVRVLGGGSNVLISDNGFDGVVVRLTADAFSSVSVSGTTVTAAGGATLSHVISESVKAGLAGLEQLAGIPGTVGGAIHGNAGTRLTDVGNFVTSVSVLTATGELRELAEDALTFSYRTSSVDELVVLSCTLELKQDEPEAITERMRKVWIMKKATQPLSSQSAGCIFKNPRGLSAGDLIEQAGLKGTRIGGAEISDRHANFIVTADGATCADVLQLIEKAKSEVSEHFGVDLETEIEIW
ncbi:MAG: UDP-N-acetylmuramate dehydrogenase [Planctomycetaceae bacterium]